MKRFLLFFFFCASLFCSEDRKVRICLVMATERQDYALLDCLRSATPWIDAACIVSELMSEEEREKVHRILDEHEIVGNIYPSELKSPQIKPFAIQTAQKMLKEAGFRLEETYLLLLDSDMTLQGREEFCKERLDKDLYVILQKSSQLGYSTYRPYLLRASLKWECRDILSENWVSKEPYTSGKLLDLSIEGGHSKAFEEIDLLKYAFHKSPHYSPYILRLAQTYRGMKEYEKAIEQYQKILEKGGEKEEMWFSKYMMGSCYEELKQWDKALHWYLEAFQTHPGRVESLLKIAIHYRLLGQNDLSLIFAKYGAQIAPPPDQNLFSYPPLRDYHFDEEISIAAYYTRFKEEGLTAASHLLLRRNVPWWVRQQNGRNLLFYIQTLKNARFRPIEPSLPFVEEDKEERYHPMNPSIVKTEGGYLVNCRAVNYTQMGAKIFHTADAHGIFRTKNFLLQYTPDFQLLAQKEVIDDLSRERIRSIAVEGLEDCRIFFYEGALWATCTTFDTNPTGRPQISLCKILATPCEKIAPVETLVPLLGPDPHRCEKNWLPFVQEGRLQIVYSYDPLILVAPDPQTGRCETLLTAKPDLDLSELRGSAGPLPFEGGYLILTHEVILFPDYSRCYVHRFLAYDANFTLRKVSHPFVFQHQGVEYCCSMTWDHAGKELILPIGIEDREAYLCFVDLDTLRSLLHPLPISFSSP